MAEEKCFLYTNLKMLRLKNQMTFQLLGKVSNVSPSTLYRIEKEETMDPGILTILRLADLFQISVDDLLLKDLCESKEE